MITHKFFDYLPDEAIYIRTEVFINEQGFNNEFDDIDKTAIHLILFKDNIAIGNARIFTKKDKKVFFVGRLAVLKEYRKLHLGKQLMILLEDKIKELNGTKIVLSAQCRVSAFYEKLGYEKVGNTYLDEYCPHIHMKKNLSVEGNS